MPTKTTSSRRKARQRRSHARPRPSGPDCSHPGARRQLRRGLLCADTGTVALDERPQALPLLAGAGGVGELGSGPVHPAALDHQPRGGAEVQRPAVLAALPGVGDEGCVDPADAEQAAAEQARQEREQERQKAERERRRPACTRCTVPFSDERWEERERAAWGDDGPCADYRQAAAEEQAREEAREEAERERAAAEAAAAEAKRRGSWWRRP
ncbi:hypothetical protein [Kitasatospora sp. NPDC001132]